MYDIVIKNGTVIDGLNHKAVQQDVGIVGDRIVAVGVLTDAESVETIDASGCCVAPGLIDVHTHADGWLLQSPHFAPRTVQGITTEVLMADGISYAPVSDETTREWLFYLRSLDGLRFSDYTGWENIADYMSILDGHTAQNVMTHIPYANLRALALGWGRAAPDDFQMQQLRAMAVQGMAEGAVGLSTGLDYISECYATTDELVDACRAISDFKGLYVTHIRYKIGLLQGLQEAVEISRRANVPLHVSHLKSRIPGEIEAVIQYINDVAVNEVDFSFDLYPFASSSTMLNYLLPYEVWDDGPLGAVRQLTSRTIRTRFERSLTDEMLRIAHIAWLPSRDNAVHIGKSLRAYCDSVRKPVGDALCDLLIEENLAVLLVFRWTEDERIAPFLGHPRSMIASDGIYFPQGLVHPRVFCTPARTLTRCVNEWNLFSIEEAIYKQTGFPAQRFGIVNRGAVVEGYFADIIVFNPNEMFENVTFTHPTNASIRIRHVLVNGVGIIRDGKPITDTYPGRFLRYRR